MREKKSFLAWYEGAKNTILNYHKAWGYANPPTEKENDENTQRKHKRGAEKMGGGVLSEVHKHFGNRCGGQISASQKDIRGEKDCGPQDSRVKRED